MSIRNLSVGLGFILAVAAAPMNAGADAWDDGCAAFRRLTGRAAPTTLPPVNVAALEEHLLRAEAVGFSGTAFVERSGKALLNKGYGYADWAAARPMTPDTVFDTGSVSKQFTAAAILKLEEMGKLRVEDPITRFLPDVPADKRGITLHHLLTHTSGFGLEVREAADAPTRERMVAITLGAKLQTRPGEAYDYSNAGYSLLGAVVEIASGEAYEPFLRRHLWSPSGMRDTGWVVTQEQASRRAAGYANSAAVPHPDAFIAGGPLWSRRGPGSIRSTPNDLRRWVAALRGGRVLSQASLVKLVTPHVREGAEARSYSGYGWAISAGPDGSCVIAHDGGTSLHYNVLRIHPERNLVTHTFTLNERGPLGRFVLRATTGILMAGRRSPLPEAAPADARAVRALAGRWRTQDASEVELIAVGARLLAPTSQPHVVRLFTGFAPLSPEDERRAGRTRARLPAVMDALERSDYAPLFEVLAGGDSREEEIRYWPSQWAEWKQRHGAYRGTEVIATTRRGERLLTYLLVKFDRFNVLVAAAHNAEGGVSIGNNISAEGADEFIPSEYVLAPRGEGVFHVYNPTVPAGVEVRVEAGGRLLRIRSPRGETILHRAASDLRAAF